MKINDSTIARITGNLLSGISERELRETDSSELVYYAVRTARLIATEVERQSVMAENDRENQK